MSADKWHDVPIASRVEPFLREHRDRWYTVGGIAGWAHLVEWQVERQLGPLVASGKVTEEHENRQTYYRWTAD